MICRQVKALRVKCPNLNIQVDGGLGPDTIDVAAAAGGFMFIDCWFRLSDLLTFVILLWQCSVV